MPARKEIKGRAKAVLKQHYWILVLLCAGSMFLGTEFTDVKENAQSFYDVVTSSITTLDTPDAGSGRSSAVINVVQDLVNDNVEAGREEAADRIRRLQEETDPNSSLGRTRGVFASVANNITSGNLYSEIALSLTHVFRSRKLVAALMVVGAFLLVALVWVFLRNIYSAVLRRACLEMRVYRSVPVPHLFHFKHVHRWCRVSLTLLLADVFETLWWLTIVGGVIKHYSYFMVPYITAENPDIRPMEALRISRQMMKGHKMECFLLELSYLGWHVLGFLTFGIVEILWAIPYKVTGFTEYYTDIRRQAKEKNVPGTELLNDRYLFQTAPKNVLRESYREIVRHKDIIEEDIVELERKRGFLTRNFGIWVGGLKEKAIYTRQMGLRQQTLVERMELNAEAYPERLNPLSVESKNSLRGRLNYLTPCTVWSLIVVFFTFCIAGWIWEVSLHLVSDGTFVNRGVLHGPWLPIYGGGVTLITVLLYRLRKRPLLEAVSILAVCGIVEYFTSCFMELSTGMRWWDYSGYFLNLDGRICAEGLAVFTLGGMAAVYLLVPMIDTYVTKIRTSILIPVCVTLLAVFSIDYVYSQFHPNVGEGITSYDVPGQSSEAGEAAE